MHTETSGLIEYILHITCRREKPYVQQQHNNNNKIIIIIIPKHTKTHILVLCLCLSLG